MKVSSRIQDGAGISLDRQLSMIRFIIRNNKKGVTLGEVQMQMTVIHGLSDAWVAKYLKKWTRFGVVIPGGKGFRVDEEKMKLVWKARDEEATRLEE